MKLSQGVAAIILLGSAAAAQAELTGTVTAVSDYDFRGISLSATDPALQGSIDWAAANGFYVGAWASNIDYGRTERLDADGNPVFDGNGDPVLRDVDGDIEVDLYAGFAGEIEGGMGWDVGLVWYTYPGADDIDDYPELYAGISYQWLELKQWYTNDYGGTDEDGWYTEANASYDLPANFSIGAHLGYNYGDAFDDTEYMDYSIGVGYTYSHFDFELKWVDNDLSRGDAFFSTDDAFNSEGRAIFSVSTTFPWSNE